ncbi:hypothetical protein E2562_011553 [Oryza meyeriana var. granulata]|uniref:Uncharacterized protein n=1 Tax=Oryza meyeriana var. granulata TaxID=110450 RepID=A0A6G1DWX6_9ORYZ|nr:hypothetical protein E2562_011553 [Oryza meyeriana var. granulata]
MRTRSHKPPCLSSPPTPPPDGSQRRARPIGHGASFPVQAPGHLRSGAAAPSCSCCRGHAQLVGASPRVSAWRPPHRGKPPPRVRSSSRPAARRPRNAHPPEPLLR